MTSEVYTGAHTKIKVETPGKNIVMKRSGTVNDNLMIDGIGSLDNPNQQQKFNLRMMGRSLITTVILLISDIS